jgi:hypothetical protein
MNLEAGVVLAGHEHMVFGGNVPPQGEEGNYQFFSSIQDFESEPGPSMCKAVPKY